MVNISKPLLDFLCPCPGGYQNSAALAKKTGHGYHNEANYSVAKWNDYGTNVQYSTRILLEDVEIKLIFVLAPWLIVFLYLKPNSYQIYNNNKFD